MPVLRRRHAGGLVSCGAHRSKYGSEGSQFVEYADEIQGFLHVCKIIGQRASKKEKKLGELEKHMPKYEAITKIKASRDLRSAALLMGFGSEEQRVACGRIRSSHRPQSQMDPSNSQPRLTRGSER